MAVDRIELEREIRLKLAHDGEVRRDAEAFAHQVANRWVKIWQAMGPHPYETYRYEDSIEVIRTGVSNRERHPRGAPGGVGGRFTGKVLYHYMVGTEDENALRIEFGTGWDAPGTNSTWGRFTATPEFAPAAHTAASFGGTGPD